jgi:tRNA synthetases class I (C) catalytic domain
MRLDGDKMSKSKGNMILVRDALRETHPDGLRLYLRVEHYRRPFDHDARRIAEGNALAASIRRAAQRSGTEAWTAPSRAWPLGCSTRTWIRPRCSVSSVSSRGPAIPAHWRWRVTCACASSTVSEDGPVAEVCGLGQRAGVGHLSVVEPNVIAQSRLQRHAGHGIVRALRPEAQVPVMREPPWERIASRSGLGEIADDSLGSRREC